MRFLLPLLALCGVCATAVIAQTPDAGASAPVATDAAARTPSAMLQPALAALQQTLGTLKPEKWKLSGEMRDETAANIGSINRDLADTLPPLLATADGEAGAVTKVLPVSRNIDAVYDVALRVAAMAKVGAPQQQSGALDQAVAGLQSARRELGDRLQANAVAQDKRVSDLQADLQAAQRPQPAAVVPPAQTTPKAPAKLRKPRPRPKPAKPTTPAAPQSDAAPKQP